jgi:hypothetical protein
VPFRKDMLPGKDEGLGAKKAKHRAANGVTPGAAATAFARVK